MTSPTPDNTRPNGRANGHANGAASATDTPTDRHSTPLAEAADELQAVLTPKDLPWPLKVLRMVVLVPAMVVVGLASYLFWLVGLALFGGLIALVGSFRIARHSWTNRRSEAPTPSAPSSPDVN
ncbi:MAG: hypothetical protein H6684_08985 [Deltaproteobacteria bacterium]|nr:hypothetical protein [Deltaproteobacteria bacterium]MCB9479615.1 hypothetical protein [Deltaproteobacteria bacterium]MCB9488851.1 hypothetical protein [Deltaproteobacteria bacterium]